MTIYEHEDDLNSPPFSLPIDWTSHANGDSGIPIACCNIQRMPFNWWIKASSIVIDPAALENPDMPEFDMPDLPNERGRGLADFDDEDLRKLFDYDLDEEEGEYWALLHGKSTN